MFKEAFIRDIENAVATKLANLSIPNPNGDANDGSEVKPVDNSPDMAKPTNDFTSRVNTLATQLPNANVETIMSNSDIISRGI
jgi:hypothetical protein